MGKLARWVLFITLIVLVAGVVTAGYLVSSDVQPLQAIATFWSLLLSVYLVLIYQKQNEILEGHEEVLQNQFEAQEAVEVEPEMYIDNRWKIRDSTLSNLIIENTGGGTFKTYS